MLCTCASPIGRDAGGGKPPAFGVISWRGFIVVFERKVFIVQVCCRDILRDRTPLRFKSFGSHPLFMI